MIPLALHREYQRRMQREHHTKLVLRDAEFPSGADDFAGRGGLRPSTRNWRKKPDAAASPLDTVARPGPHVRGKFPRAGMQLALLSTTGTASADGAFELVTTFIPATFPSSSWAMIRVRFGFPDFLFHAETAEYPDGAWR